MWWPYYQYSLCIATYNLIIIIASVNTIALLTIVFPVTAHSYVAIALQWQFYYYSDTD